MKLFKVLLGKKPNGNNFSKKESREKHSRITFPQ